MAQLVYLVINGGILFNIGIGSGNVGLRLIIVIIGDKIFHRILGEKFTELTTKLCGKSFVMSENESRTVNICNNICHCKGLTRTGNTKQNLLF